MTKKTAWRFGVPLFAVALGLIAGRLYGSSPSPEVTDAPAPVPVARLAAPATSTRRLPAPTVVPASAVVTEVPAQPLEERNVLATDYHPRPPDEWQGMRVNLTLQATCEESAGCGLAMACRDGRCGPCEVDSDCAGGEVCVLDHCVRRELANCRRRADCGYGELCFLSGYSPEARTNADTRPTCLAGTGGDEELPAG